MKNLSLFKIIVFYLMLGITGLLVTESLLTWNSMEKMNREVQQFSFYKELLFLFFAAFTLYFSISFYKKSHLVTELNYQKLFNGSSLPMYVMAKESFKILVVNEAMIKLYGYTEHEFLKMTAFDIRPEEEHDRIRHFLNKYGESSSESGTWVHRKKNGELFTVQITFHSVPLMKEDTYLVMVTDISKSINDEKQINDLLHLYETVNKATNDVIWDYDLAKNRLHWKQGYYDTYGYADESATNSFWAMQKVHVDDRARVKEGFEKAVANRQQEWVLEYRYICADGSFKYIRDKGYTIFDQDGQPVRMIGAMQNIDEQKKYEQKLLSQNEQLKEIAWINSHQVRRPLSNILGLINLIRDSADLEEDIMELMNLLAVSSKELDDAVILINRQTIEGNG